MKLLKMATIMLYFIMVETGIEAMTVEEAYQSIPHRRTVFRPQEAAMNSVEAEYLTQLFKAVDEAIVAKVLMKKGASAESPYMMVWSLWAKLKVPKKLQKVEEAFRDAIQNEQASLTDSQGQINAGDPRAQRASQKLHQAYDELMRLYPGENELIKQAFFDYPCALDLF